MTPSPSKLLTIITLYGRILKQWNKKSAVVYLNKLDPILQKQIKCIFTPKGNLKRYVGKIGLEQYVLNKFYQVEKLSKGA